MSNLRTYVDDFETMLKTLHTGYPFSIGYHCYDSNMHVFIETLTELNDYPPFVIDFRLISYETELYEDLSFSDILERKLTEISQEVIARRQEKGDAYQPSIIFEQLEYSDGTVDKMVGLIARYGMNPDWFVTGETHTGYDDTVQTHRGFDVFKRKDADDEPVGGDWGGKTGYYMPVFMTTSMNYGYDINDSLKKGIYYFSDYDLCHSPRLNTLESQRSLNYNEARKNLRAIRDQQAEERENEEKITEQKNNNKPGF
jgi:hypothetical protein